MNLLDENGISIHQSSDLTAIMHGLKLLVEEGTLRQVDVGNQLVPDKRLQDVLSVHATEGSWPEVIQMAFKDDAGARYRLEADTQNSTGHWQRVK